MLRTSSIPTLVPLQSKTFPTVGSPLDIGPRTRVRYAETLGDARTIFWNGAMGAFDWPRWSEGTVAVAEAVARSDAFSVVGGADALHALDALVPTDQAPSTG